VIRDGAEHGVLLLTGRWLRFKMRGNVGKYGGEPGDLYIGVQTLEHTSIRRMGVDLYSMLNVSFVDAILGGKVVVATLTRGNSELRIPPGTQHGTVLSIPGAGAPILVQGQMEERGTHYFEVTVCLPSPDEIPSEMHPILEDLAKIYDGKSGARTT